MFLGFSLHAWITIATVLTMFSVLLFTKLRSDLVFLGAIAILFLTGVLDVKRDEPDYRDDHYLSGSYVHHRVHLQHRCRKVPLQRT